MKRTSAMIPAKSDSKKDAKKHLFSGLLASDPRLKVAPRHVSVVHPPKGETEAGPVFMIKLYALLDTPGSELMTISCVDKKTDREFEMRFDERFPISMRFKTLSDEQRIEYAKEQINRVGGFMRLTDCFRSVFPKFSV